MNQPPTPHTVVFPYSTPTSGATMLILPSFLVGGYRGFLLGETEDLSEKTYRCWHLRMPQWKGLWLPDHTTENPSLSDMILLKHTVLISFKVSHFSQSSPDFRGKSPTWKQSSRVKSKKGTWGEIDTIQGAKKTKKEREKKGRKEG